MKRSRLVLDQQLDLVTYLYIREQGFCILVQDDCIQVIRLQEAAFQQRRVDQFAAQGKGPQAETSMTAIGIGTHDLKRIRTLQRSRNDVPWFASFYARDCGEQSI